MKRWSWGSWIGACAGIVGVVASQTVACSSDRIPPSLVARDATSPMDADGTGEDAGTPDSGSNTAAVERVDLGSVDMTSGLTQPIAFDIPSGVVSFTVTIGGPEDYYFIPERLEGPSAVLVNDDASSATPLERQYLGRFVAQYLSSNRVVQDFGSTASLFPNNPNVTIEPGNYRLVIKGLQATQSGTGAPYTGQVSVTLHLRKQVAENGKLDLRLYFSGAGLISAASAPSNSLVQNALTRFRGIYAQANIEIGDIEYLDVDSSYQTVELSMTRGRLEDLFTNTQGHGPGLHFLFVERFIMPGGPPGGAVAGVSGGLPGPPDARGGVNSGVAVALSAVDSDPQTLAHVMAHEAGHWLGLFHTIEFFGGEDQHPETPGRQSQNYLMFPAVGGGTQISPSQATVMRLHPEVVVKE